MNTTIGTRLLNVIARALLRLPTWLLRRIAGAPVVLDGLTLDLQTQFLILLFVRETKTHFDVEQSRREIDSLGGLLAQPSPAGVHIESVRLRGPAGDIPARLYRPQGIGTTAPAMVFYHGGGYVTGSLASHDLTCRQLAHDVACVVIAVDYRLAPEHRFPAGVDDALAAFRDIASRAAELGLDPHRLAVGGDSAGGGLAAMVAQQTRTDAIAPYLQLLIYPWLDQSVSRPSQDLFEKGFLLTKQDLVWLRDCYLTRLVDALDVRVSPLLGELAGVAPALVLVAGFDPLRDEGEVYVDKLHAAGVRADLRRYDSLVHGFFNMSSGVVAARAAFDETSALLRNAFSQTGSRPPEEGPRRHETGSGA